MPCDVRIATWNTKWKHKKDRCRRTKKTTDKKSAKKISEKNSGELKKGINLEIKDKK